MPRKRPHKFEVGTSRGDSLSRDATICRIGSSGQMNVLVSASLARYIAGSVNRCFYRTPMAARADGEDRESSGFESRRRGPHLHNESDEPEFTQPMLYQEIRQRPSVRQRYLDDLVAREVVTEGQAEAMAEQCDQQLEEEHSKVQAGDISGPSFQLEYVWRGYAEGLEPHATFSPS